MLHIDIITVLPKLLESPFSDSIVKRAIEKKLVEVQVHNLRKFGINKYNQVDDYQYGGGAGMILMVEPLTNAIEELQSERDYDEIIFMTPDAEILNQNTSNGLSLKKNILLLCGHYKGIDQRIRDKFITREISIGDYVISGGELAAAVLCDSIIRLLPGAINNEMSALTDSFQDGLLAPPVYSRPDSFKGDSVPKILLSGNQKEIEKWRFEKSLKKTKQLRPDLLKD